MSPISRPAPSTTPAVPTRRLQAWPAELALLIALTAMIATGCTSSSSLFNKLFFSSSPAKTVTANSTYTYQPAVSASSSSVTFTLIKGPSGMTINTNGLVAWAPDTADIGSHKIDVRARSGSKSGHQTWTLKVVAAVAPDASSAKAADNASFGPGNMSNNLVQGTSESRASFYLPFLPRPFNTRFVHWRDSAELSGQVPTAAIHAGEEALLSGQPLTICFTWTSTHDSANLDHEREHFLTMVKSFVETYQPNQVFFGDEVDAHCAFEQPDAWVDWLDVIDEARALVSELGLSIASR